jgi:predicted benzoate:H+ symporter BenE
MGLEMTQQAKTANQRYVARFWTGIFWYVVILFGAVWWLNEAPPEGWLRYVVAVAPALPILAVLTAMGRYLHEEPDEFGRVVLVQAMLWGLALILAFTTVWGFLEELADAPRFALYGVFPVFCGGMGVSQLFVRRRYK